MPSLYAHNKFGKLVIKNLPVEYKEIIRRYPNSFRLGLQGPDSLFFYRAFSMNKINQYGVKLHKSDAYTFMLNSIDVVHKYGIHSAEFSYIMGFICHFTLDSICHPYVNLSMNETGCGHIEIEGDLENLLLSKDGFKPERYPMHKLVSTDYATAKSAAVFYKGLSTIASHKCMRWMRLIKHLFVAPRKPKQKIIDILMRGTFHYKSFKGHMIEPEANKKCRKNTIELEKMLRDSVPVAVSLIKNYRKVLSGSVALSPRFHYDFNGNRLN